MAILRDMPFFDIHTTCLGLLLVLRLLVHKGSSFIWLSSVLYLALPLYSVFSLGYLYLHLVLHPMFLVRPFALKLLSSTTSVI